MTGPQLKAEERKQAEDQPEAIFARAIKRGLATEATVATMRESVEMGEWPVDHYAVIWRKRLADQERRDHMAEMAKKEEESRIRAAEEETERLAKEEETAEKEAKKYGKKKKKK